jgi:hypothetical protein
MEPRIRPEPTDDERRAILAALEQDERDEPSFYRSRWRAAALEEAVGDGEQAEPDGSPITD